MILNDQPPRQLSLSRQPLRRGRTVRHAAQRASDWPTLGAAELLLWPKRGYPEMPPAPRARLFRPGPGRCRLCVAATTAWSWCTSV